jgi:hypothetical protein
MRRELLERIGVREHVADSKRQPTLSQVQFQLLAARSVRLRVQDDLKRILSHLSSLHEQRSACDMPAAGAASDSQFVRGGISTPATIGSSSLCREACR